MQLTLTDSAREMLGNMGYDPVYGARPGETTPSFADDARTRYVGVFAVDQMKFGDRFAVHVGARGDWAAITEHGGLVIYGRSDATLNPGGVRIGTAEIYAQVEQIPEVMEAIAIGQDFDNDVRVILFVRCKDGVTLDDALRETIKKKIRIGASPRHVPAKVIQIADIPRTKSGKITELAVRDVVHGRAVKNKEALANPEALELFRDLPQLAS